jgi:MFS family permease
VTPQRALASGDDPRYGWAIVAALSVTETISWGIVYYAFAVFLSPMQDALGMSAIELTGAFSLALLVSAWAGVAVGRWLDHGSPRIVMTAGSAAAALLVAAWSQVHSPLAFYAVWIGLGVAMACVLYEPAFVVVSKWFTARRHRALTILTLAGALASPIFSPLAQYLSDAVGWRDALLILAAVLAVVTIPIHAIVLRPAPGQARVRDRPVRARLARTDLDRRFWLLCAGFTLSTFVSSAMGVHLIALLIESGRTAAFAALAAGAVGLSQLPGRLLFATFSDRLHGPSAAAVIFAAGGVALIVLLASHALAAIWVFVVLMGMSNGMATLVRATVLGDLYGTDRYGEIAGKMAAFTTTSRAAAPFGAAALALLPGGYSTVVVVLIALMATATAAAWRAGHPTHGRNTHVLQPPTDHARARRDVANAPLGIGASRG